MAPDHWHRPVALPTRHGKHAIMAPVIEPATGCTLVHIAEIDTDRFGTFTRDIDRAGSQLSAARAKAMAGLERSGLDLALASEGAFIADPMTGVIPWNIEVALLIDARSGRELAGMAQGPALAGEGTVRNLEELHTLARSLGYPTHLLCLRPDHQDDPRVIKGLGADGALQEAFAAALALSTHGQVFVESDLRAHCNPTRQGMIRRATEDLVRKMLSACPSCAEPGFAVTSHRPGRPCRVCESPTREPLSRIWSCGACHHSHEDRNGLPERADPARCDNCNP